MQFDELWLASKKSVKNSDWFENSTTQTKRESTNFPTSLIEFWTSDAKVTTLWIGLENMWRQFWFPRAFRA